MSHPVTLTTAHIERHHVLDRAPVAGQSLRQQVRIDRIRQIDGDVGGRLAVLAPVRLDAAAQELQPLLVRRYVRLQVGDQHRLGVQQLLHFGQRRVQFGAAQVQRRAGGHQQPDDASDGGSLGHGAARRCPCWATLLAQR